MYGGVTSHRYELWLQRWLAGGTLAWWGTGWAGAAGLVLQRAGEKAHRKAVQTPGKRAPESGLAQCGEREEQPLGLLFAPSCCDGHLSSAGRSGGCALWEDTGWWLVFAGAESENSEAKAGPRVEAPLMLIWVNQGQRDFTACC